MTDCLKISLLTIFPKIFENFLCESLVGKAIERNLLQASVCNIRNFSEPPHYRVDDTPYGGGPGMVMRAETVCKAVENAKQKLPTAKVVLLSASGARFTQARARELSQSTELIFVCGRYEGIDQRAIDLCVDLEFSIGDFVMMGGEVAAMAILESVLRLRPGVLGNDHSSIDESFSLQEADKLLLEAPQYTKPVEIRGLRVPDILLSGDHSAINKWRLEQSKARTIKIRPDLLLDNAKNMSETSNNKKDVSVVLLHEGMHDKQGKVVTTSLTLIDVHDIARSSRTYGITNCFIAHPSPTLQRLARTLKGHWETGYGASYNPNRSDALARLEIVCSLDDAIAKIHIRTGKLPLLIATSSRRGPGKLGYEDLRNKIEDSEDPFLIMIGTGHGMSAEVFARANVILAPIESTESYNFLSCRSATAIILDRLLGLRS